MNKIPNCNGPLYNCHAHCFTLDHVPEYFFKALAGGSSILRISRIRRSPFLQWVLKLATGSFFRAIVGIFSENISAQLGRLHGLLKYGVDRKQQQVIDQLKAYYPDDFRFVLLTVDMKYMAAGKPKHNFDQQLSELAALKKGVYKELIYPFVFADPRRPGIAALVKSCLTDKDAPFQGIKIYPAMGYFPFEKGMKEIYEFAVANEVPVLTHCIDGPVFYRGKLWEKPYYATHPATAKSTTPTKTYKDPAEFQLILSHPLNYECLLNPAIATRLFGEPVNFSKLKICIGHFGGEDEWALYRKQQKKSQTKYLHLFQTDPLDIYQTWLGEATERLNWLTIVQALMRKYENVYADISFTLHDESIYPMLKEMLNDPKLQKRVLFGTDYYVVASVAEEPSLLEIMQKHLDSEEICQIARNNARNFLTSKINPINSSPQTSSATNQP